MGCPVTFDFSQVHLSNLDKHRHLHLPDHFTPELSLETGIDLGDGSLFCSPSIGSRGSYYVYSISQRFPDEWFGIELFLKPLILRLYNLKPKSKRSSASRNGINLYTYSKGLFLYKTRVLNLPSGTRSRNLTLPIALPNSFEHQRRFWSGYQYSDGSFYCQKMARPVIKITSSSLELMNYLQDFANVVGVDYSFGKEHPTVGYSLRISSEPSLNKWVEHVPLLNPVHVARFLLWRSGCTFPKGLHLAQYMGLALGFQEASQLTASCETDEIRRRYLDETLQLVCNACIGTRSITPDGLRVSANLRNVEHAEALLRDLFECGLVTRALHGNTSCTELTDRGQSRFAELKTFWSKLAESSPAIAHFS